jgi:hypothetical protein
VEVATKAIERLGGLSVGLPALGERIGTGLHDIAVGLSGAVDHMRRLAEAAEHPERVEQAYRQSVAQRTGSAWDGFDLWAANTWYGKLRGLDEGTAREKAIRQMVKGFGYTGDQDRVVRGLAQALADQSMEVETYTPALGPDSVRYTDRFANPAFVRRLVERESGRLGFLPGGVGGQHWPEYFPEPTVQRQVRAAAAAAAPDSDVPDLVRQLIHDEGGLPSYATMLQSLGALSGRVEDAAGQTALATLARQEKGIFATNLSGNPKAPVFIGDVFTRIRGAGDDLLGRLDTALLQGGAVSNPSAQLQANVKTLSTLRGQVPGATNEALQTARDHLVELAQNYGLAMSNALGDLPPFAAAEMQRRIAQGATSVGDKIAQALVDARLPLLDRAKDIGIGSLPLNRQQTLTQARIDAEMRAVEASGQYGELIPRDGLETDPRGICRPGRRPGRPPADAFLPRRRRLRPEAPRGPGQQALPGLRREPERRGDRRGTCTGRAALCRPTGATGAGSPWCR